jgi:hypothetical protein
VCWSICHEREGSSSLLGYTDDSPVKPADRTFDLTSTVWSPTDTCRSSTTSSSSWRLPVFAVWRTNRWRKGHVSHTQLIFENMYDVTYASNLCRSRCRAGRVALDAYSSLIVRIDRSWVESPGSALQSFADYFLGIAIAYEENSSDVTLVVTRSLLLSGCTETSITGIPEYDGSRGTDFRSCATNTSRSSGDMSACHTSLSEVCIAPLHTQPEPPWHISTSESTMHCPTIIAMVGPHRRTIKAEWKIPSLTPLSNNRIVSPCWICWFARPTNDPSGVRSLTPPAVVS